MSRIDQVKAAVYKAVPDKYDRITVERVDEDDFLSNPVVKIPNDLTAGDACSIQSELEEIGAEFESELSSENDSAIWVTDIERGESPDYPTVTQLDTHGGEFAWSVQEERGRLPELYCVKRGSRDHTFQEGDWLYNHADGGILEVRDIVSDDEIFVKDICWDKIIIVPEEFLRDECSLITNAGYVTDQSYYSLKQELSGEDESSDSESCSEPERCFEKDEPEYFDNLTDLANYHDERAEVVREIHRLAAEVDCDFGGVGRHERFSGRDGDILIVRGTVNNIEAEPVQKLLNHDRLRDDTQDGRTVEYNVERNDYTFKVKITLPKRPRDD